MRSGSPSSARSARRSTSTQISATISGDLPETVAAAARDTLATAAVTADRLPSSVATELLDAARLARPSITSLHSAAAASIAVLVIAATLTLRYLRAPQPPDTTRSP